MLMMDVKGNSNSSSSTTQSDEEMMGDLRRGPWTVEEDFKLINYIATHGEGRWNSLARCAGLKRTGKSCRLRWLNYLRPDVRRGNITLEEQLMILELHSRWGNRWSKIAQHLPGRTDNEIKNYWRTRVQKHAKQLKCDVNSKQFKDTMRYLWMPRLVERIQAAAAATATNTSSTSTATVSAPATNQHSISNRDVGTGNLVMAPHGINGNDFGVSHVTQSYTPENSSTAASSDSFATQVSPVSDLTTDYYNIPVNRNTNPDYFQAGQVGYSESMISPPGFFNHGLDFQAMEHSSNQWPMDSGDTSDNMWNLEDIWFLQQQLNNL
ncbi:hypothetical protein POPTR_008G101400v4 [Populus trichocarpa]|uniref:Uncharacterized protein n=1 Tax=Populus trichocarpa TaxID=3694 RepID=A0ACC0SKV2_POPTR|nr:transcription factor MYB108 [Populus trichocarpa]KAI9389859.1 hypothetical protein POPTR_008G101400v4 [Populus trichocarpa]